MTRVPLRAQCAYQPEGSAWQGGTLHDDPERGTDNAAADLLLNALLARITGSLSPAALGTAWFDWASHLLLAPSKVAELWLHGGAGAARWLQYAAHTALAGAGAAAPLIEPLAQDRRFNDPAWRQWPWTVLSQGFLLQQQWWHRATTGVRGVSRHHSEVVTFLARQLLDCAAPSNFLSTNPVVQAATLRSGGGNLLAGSARAATDWTRALAGKPADTGYLPGRDVAVTPGRVVLRNGLIELLRYDPVTPVVHAAPLLIVPAWIMKYYILDLSPHNSLVRYLVARGHTVFMVSWKNPGADDRALGMDDYRQLGVMAALDAIRAQTGAERVNACGYCLGGTLLAIAAAAMARDGDDRLAGLTLLAAQVDFTEPGELSLFIDESAVSYLEAAMWAQGYLDTRQMAGAFQLLRSNDLVWSRRLKHYLLDLPDRDTDLMAWNADATRLPARMHSEYLRRLFLQNDLANGRYLVGGRPVALTDIEVPVFAVGTLTDHVAPWRSVYKLVLLADTDVTFLLTSGGHNVGVVAPPDSGARSYQVATHRENTAYIDAERWHACVPVEGGSWWPEWAAWLAQRAGPLVPVPASGPSAGPAPGTYVLQR
ncbi:polyhydroxyalkanoate synthase [Pseudoduganella lurida]|uniref:Polyhydroxyalkanoate synthase n=1 Tax=Pseudoduganella lurida TaxID=1036180 RepID=A0A562RDX9_9BURK|nr:alpha/beta fold hydrolase [Pseudoduganella lurida]TWI67272.1 polyhydroxyalkanoate synthase [Pseudoduganella lurida]